MSAHICRSCGQALAAHTRATDCPMVRDILAYEADVAAGRDQEPGYWMTEAEVEALLRDDEGGA